ncbi:LuxR C-terminal-related transcriptional regulator [Streptomyces albicerus]|uniref:LuxR C-terminal-related transcriptional regulator n=1 Tax=Streptomyces albicerus TaxID=2569859 RepID=UPI001788ABAD
MSGFAVGLSNAAIAERLTVSTDTIKGHISSIHIEIGTGNRVTVGVPAWQRGLVECPLHGARVAGRDSACARRP